MERLEFLYDQIRCIGCDACNYCRDAAGVKSCPTGVMHYCTDADGTVGHNQKKCIDCGTCTWACLTHCLEFRVLEENEVPYFRPLLSKVCETGRWRRYGI